MQRFALHMHRPASIRIDLYCTQLDLRSSSLLFALQAKLQKDMDLDLLKGPMVGKIVKVKKDICLQIPCATPPALAHPPPNNCFRPPK